MTPIIETPIVDVLMTPAAPPHPSSSPPSRELLETIQVFHDAIRRSHPARIEGEVNVNRPSSLIEALEYFHEDRQRNAVGKDRVNLLARSVNAVMREMQNRLIWGRIKV